MKKRGSVGEILLKREREEREKELRELVKEQSKGEGK